MLENVKVNDLSELIDFNLVKQEVLDYIENHDKIGKELLNSTSRGGYRSNNLNIKIIEEKYSNLYCLIENVLSNSIDIDFTDIVDKDGSFFHIISEDKKTLTAFWINLNKKGIFNKPHHHGTSSLSGCVYVDVPEDLGGEIVFHEDNQKHYIVPKRGMLLTFESSLTHSVLPHFSDTDRISIAFNIYNK